MPLYDEFVTTLVREINFSALHTYNHGVTYDHVNRILSYIHVQQCLVGDRNSY